MPGAGFPPGGSTYRDRPSTTYIPPTSSFAPRPTGGQTPRPDYSPRPPKGDGGQTPMRGGGSTPMHGGATPRYSGSATPMSRASSPGPADPRRQMPAPNPNLIPPTSYNSTYTGAPPHVPGGGFRHPPPQAYVPRDPPPNAYTPRDPHDIPSAGPSRPSFPPGISPSDPRSNHQPPTPSSATGPSVAGHAPPRSSLPPGQGPPPTSNAGPSRSVSATVGSTGEGDPALRGPSRNALVMNAVDKMPSMLTAPSGTVAKRETGRPGNVDDAFESLLLAVDSFFRANLIFSQHMKHFESLAAFDAVDPRHSAVHEARAKTREAKAAMLAEREDAKNKWKQLVLVTVQMMGTGAGPVDAEVETGAKQIDKEVKAEIDELRGRLSKVEARPAIEGSPVPPDDAIMAYDAGSATDKKSKAHLFIRSLLQRIKALETRDEERAEWISELENMVVEKDEEWLVSRQVKHGKGKKKRDRQEDEDDAAGAVKRARASASSTPVQAGAITDPASRQDLADLQIKVQDLQTSLPSLDSGAKAAWDLYQNLRTDLNAQVAKLDKLDALETLRTKLDGVSGEVTKLVESSSKREEEDATARSSIRALREKVEKHTEALQVVSDMELSVLNGDAATSLSNDVQDLKGKVQRLHDSFSDLLISRKAHGKRIAEAEMTAAAHQTSFNAFQQTHSRTSANVDGLAIAVSSARSALDAHVAERKNVDNQAKDNVLKLQQTIESTNSNLRMLRTEINAWKTAVLQAAKAEASQAVEALQSEVEGLKAQLKRQEEEKEQMVTAIVRTAVSQMEIKYRDIVQEEFQTKIREFSARRGLTIFPAPPSGQSPSTSAAALPPRPASAAPAAAPVPTANPLPARAPFPSQPGARPATNGNQPALTPARSGSVSAGNGTPASSGNSTPRTPPLSAPASTLALSTNAGRPQEIKLRGDGVIPSQQLSPEPPQLAARAQAAQLQTAQRQSVQQQPTYQQPAQQQSSQVPQRPPGQGPARRPAQQPAQQQPAQRTGGAMTPNPYLPSTATNPYQPAATTSSSYRLPSASLRASDLPPSAPGLSDTLSPHSMAKPLPWTLTGSKKSLTEPPGEGSATPGLAASSSNSASNTPVAGSRPSSSSSHLTGASAARWALNVQRDRQQQYRQQQQQQQQQQEAKIGAGARASALPDVSSRPQCQGQGSAGTGQPQPAGQVQAAGQAAGQAVGQAALLEQWTMNGGQ